MHVNCTRDCTLTKYHDFGFHPDSLYQDPSSCRLRELSCSCFSDAFVRYVMAAHLLDAPLVSFPSTQGSLMMRLKHASPEREHFQNNHRMSRPAEAPLGSDGAQDHPLYWPGVIQAYCAVTRRGCMPRKAMHRHQDLSHTLKHSTRSRSSRCRKRTHLDVSQHPVYLHSIDKEEFSSSV